ncbi:MAG: hypothetical protein R3222_06720, partial [Balneolaceae bacterium]|nr:hypothetical protein [Balneolaceae bacterium]
IEEVWELILDYISATKENGYFEQQRNRQAKHWMYESINNQLQDAFYNDPEVKKQQKNIEQKVLAGKMSSFKAAQKLLEIYKA